MSTKGIKISMWICIAVLSLQFLAAGSGKILGSWAGKFSDWGYPIWFMYLIGLLEIVGLAGLYHSRTRKWSAAILILIMAGAAYTHLTNQEYPRIIHNAIIGGISALVLILSNKLRALSLPKN